MEAGESKPLKDEVSLVKEKKGGETKGAKVSKSKRKRSQKESLKEESGSQPSEKDSHPYGRYLGGGVQQEEQKGKEPVETSSSTATSESAYPVSLTGSCPTCHSTEVTYIIMVPKGEEDLELPLLLEKLVQKGRAVKLNEPETGQEIPSFQCGKCGYGFNLDWTATSLESIFNVTPEGEDKSPQLPQAVAAVANPETTVQPPQQQQPAVPDTTPPGAVDASQADASSAWYSQAYGQTEAADPQFTKKYEDYNIHGNFNVLTGKFQRLSNDQHWTERGLPTDRDVRQLAHFMNVNLADQEPKKKQFKPTAKQIQRFKKEKEEKKRKKLLQTYADY